ncbi:unnamed protein product, partial [Linum tenue]
FPFKHRQGRGKPNSKPPPSATRRRLAPPVESSSSANIPNGLFLSFKLIMAEDVPEAAEVWRWVIEYLPSVKEFDRQLLEELVESVPDVVRKSAEEMLQSPLPAKCTLELLKEKILGGFISEEYSKRWCGVVPDSMESDSVLPMECSGAQINQRLSTDEAGDKPQGSDSIEDDSSDDDVVLVDISGANAGVEVQNGLQQSTAAETVHSAGTSVANRDGRVGLDGKKSVRDDDRDGSVHIEGSEWFRIVSNHLMKNYNASSSEDVPNSKQSSGAVVENPLVNCDGNRNELVKSGGNKPIETSHSGSSTYVKSSAARANDKQPSRDGGDRPLQNGDMNHQQVKLGENYTLVEKNRDHSLSTRSSNNPLSNGDVQNGKQPPAAALEHPLVNGDGNRDRPIQHLTVSSTSVKTSDARAVNSANNSKQPSGSTGIERPSKKSDKNPEQLKSGGYGTIEKNRIAFISMKNSDKAAPSNDEDIQNRQPPPGPAVGHHHPLVSGDVDNAKLLKSRHKKPIQMPRQVGSPSDPGAHTNQVQNHQQPSHMETEKDQQNDRLNRKRKVNDFLENHQLLPAPGIAGPTDLNLCVKCHQTGAVLVCATAGCPMMLHKSCLGFNVEEGGGEGSFHCPLCSYSRAVAELREAQRRVALTRKDLSGFVVGMQL